MGFLNKLFGGERAPHPEPVIQVATEKALAPEVSTTASVDMNRAQEMADAQALAAAQQEIAAAEEETPIAMGDGAEDEEKGEMAA